MNKGLVPKLVNISDTSDSESSGSSGCEKGKEIGRSRWRERSRSGGKSRSRSRGKSRSRSPGKSKSRWKSRSRSRSHSRSRSRGKSRSRSRDKSRSRGKSRSRSRGRSRSRSRGHSRSRSRGKSRSRSRSRGRDSHDRRRRSRKSSHSYSYKWSKYHPKDYDRDYERSWRRGSPQRSNRSHKTLSTLEKLGIELKPPKTGTASALPSYYNHMALNPTRYAQQLAKRKLIWGNKGTETEATKASPSLWQGATFSQDEDGKLTAKFKRLMGIKAGEGTSNQDKPGQDLIKRQQELFSSMELQYEAARQATHTQRGVGLGFGAAIHPQ